MASKFLGGFCKHASVDIVEIWVKSPWGIPKKGRWEWNGMFSMDHDFRLLKPARPGITSFAIQIVQEQLEKDIQWAVKKSGGLHTFTTGGQAISDDNYGAQTFAQTTSILKERQPLAMNLLVKLATPRKSGTVVAVRQYRPPEMVCSSLNQTLSVWH